MYCEFIAIVTCRVMYIAFRQHRFVINFGYGFDANDENMTTVTMLITSTFLELILEGCIDAVALGEFTLEEASLSSPRPNFRVSAIIDPVRQSSSLRMGSPLTIFGRCGGRTASLSGALLS